MRLAVIGSRTFTNEEFIFYMLDEKFKGQNISLIVSGGAKGVDTISEKYAKINNIETKIFLPDWSKGRSAGLQRNTDIIKNCDKVIAFWDYESRGTFDSIKKAEKMGIECIIIDTRNI